MNPFFPLLYIFNLGDAGLFFMGPDGREGPGLTEEARAPRSARSRLTFHFLLFTSN
jgi:hypothetical protein